MRGTRDKCELGLGSARVESMFGLFPAQHGCNRRQWLGLSTLAGLAGWSWPGQLAAGIAKQSGSADHAKAASANSFTMSD